MARRDKYYNSTPTRTIYTALAIRCPLCLELYNKSKKFGTPYHLLYHLNDHNSDDQTSTKITINDIRLTVKQICQAIEWQMFFVKNGDVVFV